MVRLAHLLRQLCREIMAGQPAAATIACPDEAVAHRFQQACRTSYFRPYTSTDVIGCELGGAVKNVIALAVGIAHGMGTGHNATAVLISRGLAETTRLATAMGADPVTLAGLAGLGDLVATCTSPLSRNRTFGTHLGRGLTLVEAVAATRQTTEGVKSAEAVLDLARVHGVDMPITETITALLHRRITLAEAATALMDRPPKPERWELTGGCADRLRRHRPADGVPALADALIDRSTFRAAAADFKPALDDFREALNHLGEAD